MSFLRFSLVVLAIGLLMACLYAYLTGDFLGEFQMVLEMPWGQVALFDLYLGFFLFAIIILAFEPIIIGLQVVILLFVFGNWIAAFWLALRLPKMIRKMRGVA